MATLPSQPTLADLQHFIEDTVTERGWTRVPAELMLLLTEEVGEVAKGIRREMQLGAKKPENTDHLAEELVDVLNYVLDIANCYDIDMEQAFQAKWQKNASRTW